MFSPFFATFASTGLILEKKCYFNCSKENKDNEGTKQKMMMKKMMMKKLQIQLIHILFYLTLSLYVFSSFYGKLRHSVLSKKVEKKKKLIFFY